MRRLCIIVLSSLASVALLPLPAAQSGTSDAAEVVLVEAGEEPREVLRISPVAGETRVTALTMQQTIEQSGATQLEIGPIDIRLLTTTTVGEPTSADAFPVTFSYSDAEVLDSSIGSDAELAAVQDSLESLEDLSGSYMMTTSGAILDSQFDVPDSIDPAAGALLEQLSNQADQLVVPFPAEAVGVGARWRAVTSVEVAGIELRQKYTYTLRSRDGTRLEFDIRFVQTAPRGKADLPGVPSNVDVTITKFKTRGSGAMTIDLTTPFPISSSLDALGEQRFTADDGVDTATIIQRLELGVKFEEVDEAG